ncbi:hypothetical protein DL766_000340 [Monosporascus sp. MC13-8B]|uniref:Bud22 domain-containing protein n=1 Tax=Monosporascus cannonballus TaxID=155416 RepID=A0ABY0HK36_9PEZI|nr:hypothetical protein DL762_001652 [Monosporascus cannonballus]RYP39518.1 hypothetical protein DL766_000340 [Monosporascus sp. MC13-8B]
MPKRKRGEPSLEEKLAQWEKELYRGLKTAKGFERQRYAKRIRDSPPEKVARLEKEVLVLKSLDLHQTAHAHLCTSLLKIKGVAEAPRLPAEIKPVPKPRLSEDEQAALHNVTSALYNRKQVKDVIEQAVMGTCIALRVPMPDKKKGKGKGDKGSDKNSGAGAEKGELADATTTDPERNKRNPRAEKEEQPDDISMDDAEEKHKKDAARDTSEGPVLLKRKTERPEEDEPEHGGDAESSDGEAFEGFSDSEAEERAFSRYDDLLGGSSDEDGSEDEGSESEDNDDLQGSRTRSLPRVVADDISVSSAEESEGSEAESLSSPPPSKKSRTKTTKVEPIKTGTSAFLPTLMGGYISGSESASDVDVAPAAKKNRRGQRARQAIWEKKYGERARHKQEQAKKMKDSRDSGWDMRRGAVDEDGGAKPWKKGIRNPFEKSAIHPDRQRQVEDGNRRQHRRREQANSEERQEKPAPRPRPEPKKDDAGPLHPSWAAAKKAKEENQKVAFQGRKVVFD